MEKYYYKFALISVAVMFSVFFAATIVPPLIDNFDLIGAIKAGFVNPYASGYSTDVILCWVVLAIWVFHEARVYSVKHGWLCLLVGLVPGVAVGFSLYLLLRLNHFDRKGSTDT